jgi:hypothetical protein
MEHTQSARQICGAALMRLCVTGGRSYRDRAFLFRALDATHRVCVIDVLIHGACPSEEGADWLADAWALENGIAVERYPVDNLIDGPWPAAGPQRNRRMLHYGKPGGIIAFEGGPGTDNCVKQAKKLGIKVWDLRTR